MIYILIGLAEREYGEGFGGIQSFLSNIEFLKEKIVLVVGWIIYLNWILYKSKIVK